MEAIWWQKIPNSALFIQRILDEVINDKSVILQLPETIPWYCYMKSIIEENLTKENSVGVFKSVDCDEFYEPGKYLFENYCKPEIRVTYRPSKGYAKFLAEHEEIDLHDNILWVNTTSEKQYASWVSFVESYYDSIPKNKPRCKFIVETRNQNIIADRKKIKVVSYNQSIEHYDNVLFNMLTASSLVGSEIYKRYLAEVVSLLFPNDVELSSKCISKGKSFLIDMRPAINDIIENDLRSNGLPFGFNLTDEMLSERLWEAQIKVLFPIIERYRNYIVQKYKAEIEEALPITTNYGDIITSAADVELGPITSLVAGGKVDMSPDDYQKVTRFKNARNSLAHFTTLKQSDVDYIIS